VRPSQASAGVTPFADPGEGGRSGHPVAGPHRVAVRRDRRRGLLLALSAAVTVVVTVDVLAGGPLTRIDHSVHRFADRDVRGGWKDAADTVRLLGQRWVLLHAIVPLAVVAGVRTRSFRPPLTAGLIVVGLSAFQVVIKSIIPRTYPASGEDLLFVRDDAYPSGHTLNGFVLVWVGLELSVLAFPGILVTTGRLMARRRVAIALLTGSLTAVALTLSDVHWTTDVLASLGLGIILLDLLVRADPFRTRRPVARRAGRLQRTVPAAVGVERRGER
jgi:membrane-associated phospholipid phosphatase